MRRSTRLILLGGGGLLVASLCVVRGIREVVPRGASLEPFLLHSRELPALDAPNGTRYRVFVNDAGAMHSGNHWTWIVDRNWITGRRVVAAGYLRPDAANGIVPLDVTWEGDRPVVRFEQSRR